MIKVLFVCMGNICRSPAAHGIFQSMLMDAGLEDSFEVDSAGTHGYHAGALPDSRMRSHAENRGYVLTHRARQFEAEADYIIYDYILYMDDQNESELISHTHMKAHFSKLKRLSDYCRKIKTSEVPDPYYGGAAGFEKVMDILEEACAAFLAEIIRNHKLEAKS